MSETKNPSNGENASGAAARRDSNPESRAGARDRARGAGASRRRFLKLVAAGSAAVLASPLEAATAEKKPAAKEPALPPEIQAEIKNQKDYLARTLVVIRDFELSTGSEPAGVFRPLVSPRRSDREGGKR